MKQYLFPSILLAATVLVGSCNGRGSSRDDSIETRSFVTDASASTVSVTGGQICGYIDGGVYIYKGVPYAKAARFREPGPVEKWEGVRSCRHYGPVSPHPDRTAWFDDESAFTMDWDDGFASEDCQNLNIWTNGINDGKARPVMVWLHGGAFNDGSSHEQAAYDGRNLAKGGDVVVVSVNHRLNVVGFLDLSSFGGDYAKSSNLGMKDIVKALEWVRDNIATFGGDPSNVTIFGQSGGGGKVSTTLATPSAYGLFHKAIVHSGSQLRVMEQVYSRKIGERTAELLGLDGNSIDKILEVPYPELLAAGNQAVSDVRAEAPDFDTFIFGWAPTVDGDFLPAHPFDGKAPSFSKDIPMIIGTTQTEFMARNFLPQLKNLTLDKAKAYLADRYGDKTDEFIAEFAQAYPGYKTEDLVDYDFMFRQMALSLAALKTGQGGAPVWMFLFRFESPVIDGKLRSAHCMDLPFAFDNVALYRTETGGKPDAVQLGHWMSRAWVNFARTGNPNGVKGLPKWDPYTPQDGTTMLFDVEPRVVRGHDKSLMAFDAGFGPRRLK